jgi:transposase InsO family protein
LKPTRVRSPQTNGVVERFFGTLKDEHRSRATIGDGNALAVEHCDARWPLADPLVDWEVLT